jgi:predicted CoA-binding protein
MYRVAVVGASAKPTRYSYRALKALQTHGFTGIPVSRRGDDILGLKGYARLGEVPPPVDTVTMYVSAERQGPIIQDILAVKPRRVIFNPGAENPDAYDFLRAQAIGIEEACTLVLLATGQF